MRKVSKVDTRSQATAYGVSAVLLSLPFVGLGAYFALAGFRFLPLPGRANGPLEVIGFVGLGFSGAGAIFLVHGVRGIINRLRKRKAANRHYAEPWFLDHAWDPEGIRDQAGRRASGALVGALFFAVFLVPFNWWAFFSNDGGLFITVIVGIFDLCLLLVVGTALYRTAQFFKFGHARLSFRRFPFHPGESLQVALRGTPLDGLNATLRFIEERMETHGSGKHRRTQLVSYEHFGERKELTSHSAAHEVEISFEIPDKTEWVTELSGTPVRYWELVVESARPGIDFRTTFPLPVYPRN